LGAHRILVVVSRHSVTGAPLDLPSKPATSQNPLVSSAFRTTDRASFDDWKLEFLAMTALANVVRAGLL
jgi:hypothetical protein